MKFKEVSVGSIFVSTYDTDTEVWEITGVKYGATDFSSCPNQLTLSICIDGRDITYTAHPESPFFEGDLILVGNLL